MSVTNTNKQTIVCIKKDKHNELKHVTIRLNISFATYVSTVST